SIDSGGRSGVVATYELPFDVPGEPCDLGGARILVPGFDRATGEGQLEIVRLYAETSTIEAEQRVACGKGVDPSKVYFDRNDGFLYVYDFADYRLLAAPFDGSRLPRADELSVAATSGEVGALSQSYMVRLSEPFEASRGVRVDAIDCMGPL